MKVQVLSSAPNILKPKLHLIFIPGLGDAKPTFQRLAVKTWRLYGVDSELFQMNWADGEAWSSKYERLLDRIDRLTSADRKVALVGASAGGAAAINAFADRRGRIAGVVLISGKIQRPEAIGQKIRQQNPAFAAAADACPAALKRLDSDARSRIQSRFALFDETVWIRDSMVDGADNVRVFTVGHALTIGLQLVFGAGGFIRFVKRTTK